jgi:hypothetical protein
MPITLQHYADIVAKEIVPLGATMSVDADTDNLLVTLSGVGFAITRKYLDDHMPEVTAACAKSLVGDILAGKPKGMCEGFMVPVEFQTEHELRNPPSPFDPVSP